MSRVREEDGWVVVIAIIVMTIMLAVGLGVFSYVDAQQAETRVERTRESSFNLTEGLLSSEVFILSRKWPAAATAGYGDCTYAQAAPTTQSDKCPDPTSTLSSFDQTVYANGVSWSVSIRDNPSSSPNFYSDAVTNGQPAWDANHDNQVWVRAKAIVRGRPRSLVGLVKVATVTENPPRNVMTTGWFKTDNAGNKVVVDTQGTAAQTSQVAVRCATAGAGCADYEPNKGQVSPGGVTYDYSGASLSDEAIQRLRDRAKADGTWFANSCPTLPDAGVRPTDPNAPAPVVFVEMAPPGGCSYQNVDGNTATKPGMFVIYDGPNSTQLQFQNGGTYYGLVYLVNHSNNSGLLLDIHANASVHGAVMVDGPGGVNVGESKYNLVYEPNAFSAAVSYATAGIVQNTWREIPPS